MPRLLRSVLRSWSLACLLSGGLLASASGEFFHAPLAGTSTTASAFSSASFSQIVVFGDSLSDTGNFANTTESDFGVRYPGNDFNYADGRFTDDGGTTPAAKKYSGVWHEQLAAFFLHLPTATCSLDGGADFAYGDAETLDGQRDVEVEAGLSIKVDNLGQQVTNYLANRTVDPLGLYIVWAGANDLFADASAANVAAAAQRETALVQRLAESGVKSLLVPNLPPLGQTPAYSGDSTQSAALDQASFNFRDQLNADLDALETTLASEGLTVKIYRLDIFTLFTDAVANGSFYGFTATTTSAQAATGKADASLFWDGVHPTTYGHFQIAAAAYTLLTGTPVVEISQESKDVDRSNGGTGTFLLTRTGTDLSQTIDVPYVVGGTAASGADYAPLKGHKKIKAGKRTVKIPLNPTFAAVGTDTVNVKLTLQAGTDYTLPVVLKSSILLEAGPAQ